MTSPRTQPDEREEPSQRETDPILLRIKRIAENDDTPAREQPYAPTVDLLHKVGYDGAVYKKLLDAQGCGLAGDSGHDFIEQYLEDLAPRNAIERMLAIQMLFQHVRIGRLSVVAASETREQVLRGLNKAIDDAMNLYRRQALAWRDLREPMATNVFSGSQVNVGQNQVVSNCTNAGAENPSSSNEQGSTDESATSHPSVHPELRGPSFLAGFNTPEQAVAPVNGSTNGSRESKVEPERTEARSAIRGGSNGGLQSPSHPRTGRRQR